MEYFPSSHATDIEQGNERDLHTDDDHLDQNEESLGRIFYFGKDGTKCGKFIKSRHYKTAAKCLFSFICSTVEGKHANIPIDSWNLIF